MSYSIEQFKNLVDLMIDIYGVTSYKNNIIPEMTQEDIDNDLWFECPDCGEPILYEDWKNDMNKLTNDKLFVCPVCESEFEISD